MSKRIDKKLGKVQDPNSLSARMDDVIIMALLGLFAAFVTLFVAKVNYWLR